MDIRNIEIGKLKIAEYNPRKDLTEKDEEYQKIKNSITEFGYVDPIILNQDYTVIGGHQRLKVLKDLGYKEIECVVVDFDKTKEKALNIALNKISGQWDEEKLQKLILELKNDDYNLDITGFNYEEINQLLDYQEIEEDNFDLEKALEEIKEPKTKQGDIWRLGNHKLMCGDCTKEKDVQKLMKGEKSKLIITDPPYNVNYTDSKGNMIKNDNMKTEEFYTFLESAFKNLNKYMEKGAPFYIFYADIESINFRRALETNNLSVKSGLIWVKNHFTLGRQDYQHRHEPILYGWKEGASHYWYGGRNKNTVIEKEFNFENMKKSELIKLLNEIIENTYENIPATIIKNDKVLKSDLHPTMKPLTLINILIQNSSKPKDLIVDLFGGSGSTLIAAEETNRICYSMELDEKYCDVIVNRWESITNSKAEKE